MLALTEKNSEILDEIFSNLKELKKIVKKNEIKCFLSNDTDSLDCYVEILTLIHI